MVSAPYYLYLEALVNIDEILQLASYGFRLHPLMKQDKIPLLGSWQKRATTDEKTLRLWHGQYPDANYGIATGPESGILVVDIDPKNGGDQSWLMLMDENSVAPTWTVETGSGGIHYYFEYPRGKEIRNSSNKVGHGIDIRGMNGQVVSAGSIHPNGVPYKWLVFPEEVRLAKFPKWLLDIVANESIEEFTPLGGHLEKGTRNNSIYHASLALARQKAPRDFTMASVKSWLKDQKQDIDDAEVIKTVDSAYVAAEAKPIEVSDRSDTMNAELLINTYGDSLMFIPGMGWYHWNSKCWEPDFDDAIVSQLFISCMKLLQEESAQKIATAGSKQAMKDAAALAQWAVRSLSSSAIKAAIEIACTFSQVRFLPEDIDPISTQWMLNCNNGTVNVLTGELKPHDKKDRISKLIKVDYDPEAKAPFWEQTFELIFDGHRDLIEYMQRALGYSITGCQDERCFFIAWGELGSNGKSTILETIQDILGTGYAQMSDLVVITSSTVDNRVSSSLAKLQGARFVAMNEAEENQKLSEALIKQLTGGDSIQACWKYKNPFEYKPQFKLWIRTNEKPVIRSQNNAIWDRVKLIPFDKSIPKDKKLPRSEVDEKFNQEVQGILNWLIQGAILWKQEGGLHDPSSITVAVQGYRTESNIVKIFADECLVEAPGKSTKMSEIYAAYSGWSKDSGEKYIMSKTKFTQRLQKTIEASIERSGSTMLRSFVLSPSAQMYAIN